MRNDCTNKYSTEWIVRTVRKTGNVRPSPVCLRPIHVDLLVAKKIEEHQHTENMRTNGDSRRCTTQKTTSNERIYILPYSKNDAAVTLENGTAAMEEQQLLTTG